MFYYDVTFYEDGLSELKREKGIISGNSFSEVVEKLENFYDRYNLESIKELYELEDPLLKVDVLEVFGIKGIMD